ncbi:hypothetical protein N656DRAFT_250284 [Canariomyces notabilis]|uniref:Uncharacterized protein n=1 Tax=Canariomyces notabilis TaxID=2074819 RepID=A0AAN6YWA3_9PEZI|nr:hypothetical protein N656DRAFT_250284 [Canariomyces arenarius]
MILEYSMTAKPRLHTRKIHDTYNGISHIPLATHVCARARSGGSDQPLGPRPDQVFSITLFYAANRACEIYRSVDDFVTLGRALTTSFYSPAQLSPFPAMLLLPSSPSCTEKEDDTRTAATTSPAICLCTSTAPCSALPYSPASTDRREATAARLSLELNRFLEDVLGRMRGESRHGLDSSAMAALERFLRRRAGDCGGR